MGLLLANPVVPRTSFLQILVGLGFGGERPARQRDGLEPCRHARPSVALTGASFVLFERRDIR